MRYESGLKVLVLFFPPGATQSKKIRRFVHSNAQVKLPQEILALLYTPPDRGRQGKGNVEGWALIDELKKTETQWLSSRSPR